MFLNINWKSNIDSTEVLVLQRVRKIKILKKVRDGQGKGMDKN